MLRKCESETCSKPATRKTVERFRVAGKTKQTSIWLCDYHHDYYNHGQRFVDNKYGEGYVNEQE